MYKMGKTSLITIQFQIRPSMLMISDKQILAMTSEIHGKFKSKIPTVARVMRSVWMRRETAHSSKFAHK